MPLNQQDENDTNISDEDATMILCEVATEGRFINHMLAHFSLETMTAIDFTVQYINLVQNEEVRVGNYRELRDIFSGGKFEKIFSDFIEKDSENIKKYAQMNQNVIEETASFVQENIDEVFFRFQILALLEDPNRKEINSYRSIYEQEGIQIIIGEGNDIVLMFENSPIPILDLVVDEKGEPKYFFFKASNCVLIYDYKQEIIKMIEGEYQHIIKKETMTGVVTTFNGNEILNIVEIAESIKINELKDRYGEPIIRFLDFFVGNDNAYATCVGVEISEFTDGGKTKIRKRIVGNLIDVRTGKILLCDAVKIIDLISTETDTYVVVEKYTSQTLHLEKNFEEQRIDQKEKIHDAYSLQTLIYSVKKGEYLPAIPTGAKYKLFPTPHNLMVMFIDAHNTEGFYSCADRDGFFDIHISDVLEQGDEVVLYFTDEEIGDSIFHSKKGITFEQECKVEQLLYSQESIH